jgi:hypothetical protein
MSLRNAFGKSLDNYIITSRIIQGESERQDATNEEKQDVILRWHSIKFELKHFFALKLKEAKEAKGKATKHEAAASRGGLPRIRSSSSSAHLSGIFGGKRRDSGPKGHVRLPISHDQNHHHQLTSENESVDEELERAIRISVKETSRGDPEEDARIEQAIRASIQHLGHNSTVSGSQSVHTGDLTTNLDITDEEYQELIEKAMQESMELHQQTGATSQHHDSDEALQSVIALSKRDEDFRKASTKESHDAVLQRAIDESKHLQQMPDDELLRAIEESKTALQNDEVRRSAAEREEDIVLEYIKKQSLEEEAYRRVMGNRTKQEGGIGTDEDDEELRRALEESLIVDGAGPSSAPSAPDLKD